jgi:hypothetical protein
MACEQHLCVVGYSESNGPKLVFGTTIHTKQIIAGTAVLDSLKELLSRFPAPTDSCRWRRFVGFGNFTIYLLILYCTPPLFIIHIVLL